jgi:hypothetical protein
MEIKSINNSINSAFYYSAIKYRIPLCLQNENSRKLLVTTLKIRGNKRELPKMSLRIAVGFTEPIYYLTPDFQANTLLKL